jgi:hypothetical protein
MAANPAAILEADEPLPLKSTFNFASNRVRPPPANWYMDTLEDTQLGQHVKKVAQRESKAGIRGMFSRNKVDPDMKHVFIPPIEEPQGHPRNKTPSLASRKDTESEITSTQGSADPVSTSGETLLGLRLSMLPRSKPSKPISKQSTKPINKTVSMPPRRTSAAWDPPPLFQAYPQAIKHAQLTSSTLSADSILRVSSHKRNVSSRDDTKVLATDVSQTSGTRKPEKLRTKHRRRISFKSDWTEKIYVLVTSGYLLQYSGEGSFDRLPEKMMQLGKDSVAFASDVIPGKHWVLQISQAMNIDGTPAADARSLFSRLNFRSTDYRRNATSFLLILDSAEELESWITTVRREIEALGGKKYVSETGKPKAEEGQQLKERPSLRYIVKKDPDRFSNPPTPRDPSSDSPWRQPLDHGNLDPNTVGLKNHQILVSSTKRFSIATSSGSHDSQQQEPPKDNSYRLSYMSSDQRTLVTSRSSSPTCSPIRDTFKTFEESQVSQFTEEIRPRPNATAISDRRRSLQMIQNPAIDFLSSRASYARPHSIYGGPGRNLSAPSAPTPNFSIPHSVSKPYSTAKTPEIAGIPDLIKPESPDAAPESVKTRIKNPKTPSAVRPLSPVLDSPSKVRQPLVYSPTGSQNALERRPSVSRVSTHTPTGSPPTVSPSTADSSGSFRRPSVTPPNIPPKSPRRYSMQLQPPRLSGEIETPIKIAAQELPPHMVPLPPSPPPLPSGFSDHIIDRPRPPSRSRAQHLRLPQTSKPRRPASMHFLGQTITPTRQTIPPPNGTLTAVSPTTQAVPRPLLPPISIRSASKSPPCISPRQRLKQNADTRKDLRGPRSMPQLLNGPPPAPPPNCALPPIPTGMRSPLAMKNNRSSVRV